MKKTEGRANRYYRLAIIYFWLYFMVDSKCMQLKNGVHTFMNDWMNLQQGMTDAVEGKNQLVSPHLQIRSRSCSMDYDGRWGVGGGLRHPLK